MAINVVCGKFWKMLIQWQSRKISDKTGMTPGHPQKYWKALPSRNTKLLTSHYSPSPTLRKLGIFVS